MSNKLVKNNDNVKQRYVGCTATTIGKVSNKDKTKNRSSKSSREELLSKAKRMCVYAILLMGLGIFIFDGTLYEFCNDIGIRYSFDGKYLFLGVGCVYFIIFTSVIILLLQLGLEI